MLAVAETAAHLDLLVSRCLLRDGDDAGTVLYQRV
jgi:hypothetical protein